MDKMAKIAKMAKFGQFGHKLYDQKYINDGCPEKEHKQTNSTVKKLGDFDDWYTNKPTKNWKVTVEAYNLSKVINYDDSEVG